MLAHYQGRNSENFMEMLMLEKLQMEERNRNMAGTSYEYSLKYQEAIWFHNHSRCVFLNYLPRLNDYFGE